MCKGFEGPSAAARRVCRCSMDLSADGTGEVVLERDDQGLAAGQYVSFYQDSICLGAAVICQGSILT